jgi:hypothetical protein
MIEGSGSVAGSGSIPLTNGSGSGSRRPKNRWIRIRNTGFQAGQCRQDKAQTRIQCRQDAAQAGHCLGKKQCRQDKAQTRIKYRQVARQDTA